MPKRKRVFEVTKEAFERFLARLHLDPARQGEQYEHLHRALSYLLAQRGCLDSTVAADETINRVIQRLEHGASVSNLPAFARGIAVNVAKETVRRQKRECALTFDVASVHTAELQEREKCAEVCLERLATSKRDLLQMYHDAADKEAVACRLQLSISALRVRIHRTLNELRACVQKCIEHAADPVVR